LKKSDFHFDLPEDLIAQAPLAQRSASRLLVVDAPNDRLEDRRFTDLVELLAPRDLLVFNDTRVIPARLYGRKETGGAVEILIERITGAHEARVQLGVSKKPKTGGRILLGDGSAATVLGRDGEFFALAFDDDEPLEKRLLRLGRMPLPPYISRDAEAADDERYQTVYARETGAVAAPTAGLHFDEPLLAALAARDVGFGYVTLHVGAGTFQPVRAERIEDHAMHREWLNVGAELVEKIRRTRERGGRIVAVGTTVVRALESAADPERPGHVRPFRGETRLLIQPGYAFRVVDALFTNFHQPRSTLLALVAAFAGLSRVLEAYAAAVEAEYRFLSYGDAMWLPARATRVGSSS
jgi:S-adenosylmethionine:tRNA ribosyltransferase-isomerase